MPLYRIVNIFYGTGSRKVKAYRLEAFGYELSVRPVWNGWLGFMREGSEGPFSQVTDRPDTLNATKLAVYELARSMGAATVQPATDPCVDVLDEWQEVVLPTNER